MHPKLYSTLSTLTADLTTHSTGTKKVFLSGADTQTPLTQFAYGKLVQHEIVELHLHPTMEEFYYFLSGFGLFEIGENSFNIEPGVFIRIPNNTLHGMKNTGEQPLEFVYFGIAC